MRKTLFPLLLLLLLTGCAGRSHSVRQQFLDIRQEALAQTSFALRAALRADYGDRVYDYLLSYSGTADGGVLTVEEPLLICGVSVELGEDIRFHYDGFELDTGAVLGELSPVETFPVLLRCWQSGAVTDCWEETRDGVSCLVSEFDLTRADGEPSRLCRIWFRLDTHAPFAAELSEDGRTVVTAAFLPT